MDILPKRLSIQGKPVEEWPPEVVALWEALHDAMPEDDRNVTAANYFEQTPWRNQWDRGSDLEGFCYTLDGRRVCIHYFTPGGVA